MLCQKIYENIKYNIFLYMKPVLYLHQNSVRNYSEPSTKSNQNLIIVILIL